MYTLTAIHTSLSHIWYHFLGSHQILHVIELEGHTGAVADSPDIPSDVRIIYTCSVTDTDLDFPRSSDLAV
jgi:hypothetical protein